MSPPPLGPGDEERARRYLIGWLEWWRRAHPRDGQPASIQDLATLLGVNRSTMSLMLNVENGRAPSFGTILAIERVLGLPFGTITGTPPPK